MKTRRIKILAVAALMILTAVFTMACSKTEPSVPETTAEPVTEPVEVPAPVETSDAETAPAPAVTIDEFLQKNNISEILKTHSNVHMITEWDSGSDSSSFVADCVYFQTDKGILKVESVSFPAKDRGNTRLVTQYGDDPYTVFLVMDPDGTRTVTLSPAENVENDTVMSLVDGTAELTANMTVLNIADQAQTEEGTRLTVMGKDPDNGEEMYEASYTVDPDTLVAIRGESNVYMGDEWMGTRKITVTLDDGSVSAPEDPCLLEGDETAYNITLQIRHADGTEEVQTYKVAEGSMLEYEDFRIFTVYDDPEMKKEHAGNPELDTGISTFICQVKEDRTVYVLQSED